MEKAENGRVNTGGEKRMEQAECSADTHTSRCRQTAGGSSPLSSETQLSAGEDREGWGGDAGAGAGGRGSMGKTLPTVLNQFKIYCFLVTILYHNTQIILFCLQPEIFHFMHVLTSSLLMNKPKMIILLSVFAHACVLCKIN